MKVLVTGAAGFVGYHVVKHLLDTTDWEVVTLDRHVSIHEDLWSNHISHDLRRPLGPSADHLIGQVDAVVNLASSSDVATFLTDPVKHTANNVMGTLHMLDWAIGQRELKAFIQLSTNEVYAPAPLYDTKEWAPMIPQTPYSASKAAQEMLTIGYWKTYGLPLVIVNTMHVFGEYQPAKRFLPSVVTSLLRDDEVTIYGERVGAGWRPSTRQWTYAPDLAEGVKWMINNHSTISKNIPGHRAPDRWNLVGTELTCLNVAQRAAERLGCELRVNWQGWRTARPGYDLRFALDDRAIRTAGYKPLHGTIAGLERTIDWLKNRENK